MKKEEFIRKWLNTFVPNMDEKTYKEITQNKYIWHVFSFGIIEKGKYLVGKKARNAFDLSDKTDAIVFQLWDEKEYTKNMKEEFNSSKKLDILPETYIVSSDFSWTYISTHENDSQGLGPYFMKL